MPGGVDISGKMPFQNGKTAEFFHRKLVDMFPRLVPGHFILGCSGKGRYIRPLENWESLPVEAIKKIVKQAKLYILPSVLR